MDNLNFIFERLNKDDEHLLRADLMTPDAPILVGASVTEISRTTRYTAPFYDFFQIYRLKKLSFEDSVAVLQRLAEAQENKTALKSFREHPGRLRTLYELTGGSPRTMVLLYPIIAVGFRGDLYQDMEALLDQVSPLYKARFEELTAAQMQVVVDAVALHWTPISLAELRETTGMANNLLSSQLNRLVGAGWLEKRDTPGRGKRYEIAERFFNVWYLMRRSSRRQRREVENLARFMDVFYGGSMPNEECGTSIRKGSNHFSFSKTEQDRTESFVESPALDWSVLHQATTYASNDEEEFVAIFNSVMRGISKSISEIHFRFAAMIIDCDWYDTILQPSLPKFSFRNHPYFKSIAALSSPNPQKYLNTLPAEMRDITRTLMTEISRYRKPQNSEDNP